MVLKKNAQSRYQKGSLMMTLKKFLNDGTKKNF